MRELHRLERLQGLADRAVEVVSLVVDILPSILAVADRITAALGVGSKVLAFGNGGSAAHAQHFVAELMVRYAMADRRPLPAIALTANPSVVTAASNDYDYRSVFARQVYGLCQTGDVLFGITTSGRSLNVIEALSVGVRRGALGIALTGPDGIPGPGTLDQQVLLIPCPGEGAAEIQLNHQLVIHMICDLVEHGLFGEETPADAR